MDIRINGDYDKYFTEYLKLIQNVITRMANNSFMLKAWTATVFSAATVLLLKDSGWLSTPILVCIACVFWSLDSYYLHMERIYRALYNDVVEKFNSDRRDEIKLFNLDYSEYEGSSCFLKVMFSETIFLYYGLLIGIIIVIFLYSVFCPP